MKYTIDFESENESHYEISRIEIEKLAEYFRCPNFTDDLSDAFSVFFKDKGERDLPALLGRLGIKHAGFYFDEYW